MKPKIKYIVEMEYEPDLEDYPGCKTAEDVVKADLSNGREALEDMVISMIEEGNAKIRYEIVE